MQSQQTVRQKLERALLEDTKPSAYFRALQETGNLKPWFSEIAALIGVEQDPVFHPEGDVWEHTLLVLDAAAETRQQAKKPLPFMLSALCHDLGKPTATQYMDGRIRALGHEDEGLAPTRVFLMRLGYDQEVHDYVLSMVQLHMRPNLLVAQKSTDKAMFRLFRRSLCPEDLCLLARADHLSRPNAYPYEATERTLQEKLRLFYEKN
ncbi:MAG: hypothetical protein J6J43_00055 [Oscillospiraceae bacterium]|nr:hypothetical protein [Oscillospiraceae bacterium]